MYKTIDNNKIIEREYHSASPSASACFAENTLLQTAIFPETPFPISAETALDNPATGTLRTSPTPSQVP